MVLYTYLSRKTTKHTWDPSRIPSPNEGCVFVTSARAFTPVLKTLKKKKPTGSIISNILAQNLEYNEGLLTPAQDTDLSNQVYSRATYLSRKTTECE